LKVSASFAGWLLRSPVRAALAAGLAGLLVLPSGIMFTAWAPGAVLACLVLAGRVGAQWVPAALVAAGIPLAWGLGQGVGSVIGAGLAAALLLPTVALAAWLRRSNSLSYTVQLATVAAVLAVIGAHLLVDDSKTFWQPVIVGVEQMLQQMGGVGNEAHEIAEAYGRVAWGVVTWLITLYALLGVFVGLYWFGRSRDTQELGPRFRALKVGRVLAVFAVLALVLTALRVAHEADDVLSVMVGVFLLQGLALVHSAREANGFGVWVLVMVYVGLFLPPFTAVVTPLLLLAGWLDNWFDFRARWAKPNAVGE
jgi:uncharacterized protein YybS (DUF2232 family)